MIILYKKLSQKLKDAFKQCRLLVFDFDGVMTDNGVYIDQDGRETVRCDRGDGMGVPLLRKLGGVELVIISTEKNPIVVKRAEKLKIACWHGVDDKRELLKREMSRRNLQPSEVGYVGNDVNDLGCFGEVGLAIAVADAYEQVLKQADYITTHPGGHGAVREICELMLYAKNVHPFS